MSRGAGRVQRAIQEAFAANPHQAFTTDMLVTLAYPGVNKIEKKHRVAVLRAARNACQATGWDYWLTRWGWAYQAAFQNPRSERSVRIAQAYLSTRLNPKLRPIAEIERAIDSIEFGPIVEIDIAIMLANGAGDSDRARELQQQVDAARRAAR